MNDIVYTTSVDDKIVGQTVVDYAKNPQNIREVVKGIVKMIPEAHEKFEEIYALIKTHGHLEKYCTWQTVKEFSDKGSYIKGIAETKMETHSTEGWRDFDKNLEWANQYQTKDVRVNINGKTEYLTSRSARKDTYTRIVEAAFRKEHDGTVYSIMYKSHKTNAAGILSVGKTIEVEEDMIFNVAHTGNA